MEKQEKTRCSIGENRVSGIESLISELDAAGADHIEFDLIGFHVILNLIAEDTVVKTGLDLIAFDPYDSRCMIVEQFAAAELMVPVVLVNDTPGGVQR